MISWMNKHSGIGEYFKFASTKHYWTNCNQSLWWLMAHDEMTSHNPNPSIMPALVAQYCGGWITVRLCSFPRFFLAWFSSAFESNRSTCNDVGLFLFIDQPYSNNYTNKFAQYNNFFWHSKHLYKNLWFLMINFNIVINFSIREHSR